jgi:hypothetical protein
MNLTPWHTFLEAFCAGYGPGFRITWDDDPHNHPGALGLRGATQFAQLCEGRIIAAKPELDALHSVAHELGHGMVAHEHSPDKFGDEHLVSIEQIAFLGRLTRALLSERASPMVWLPMSREAAEELAHGELPVPVSMRALEAIRGPR